MKTKQTINIADITKALVIHKAELYQQKIKATDKLNEMILVLGNMIDKEDDDFTKEYIREEVLPYMKENNVKCKEL